MGDVQLMVLLGVGRLLQHGAEEVAVVGLLGKVRAPTAHHQPRALRRDSAPINMDVIGVGGDAVDILRLPNAQVHSRERRQACHRATAPAAWRSSTCGRSSGGACVKRWTPSTAPPRWSMPGARACGKSRGDRQRVGRSPDRATAVVLANMDAPPVGTLKVVQQAGNHHPYSALQPKARTKPQSVRQTLQNLPTCAHVYGASAPTQPLHTGTTMQRREFVSLAGLALAPLASKVWAAPGQLFIPWPTNPQPAVGQTIRQAGYTTLLTRVSDASRRNNYSRVPAFNADNTRQLLARVDGYWEYAQVAAPTTPPVLITGLAGDCEPYWDATNPDLIYSVGAFGIGLKLYRTNVASGARKEWDLTARIQAVWPTAAIMRTSNEGAPSANCRYWAWGIETASGAMLGLVTYDRQTDTVLATRNLTKKPNWVSISPTGAFVLIGAEYTPIDTRVYRTSNLAYVRSLQQQPDHGDMCLGTDGRDYWVAFNQGGTWDGYITRFDVETGVAQGLLNTYVSGGATAGHISGKAYGRPGWVAVSTDGEYNTVGPLTNEWFYRQVFMMNIVDPTLVVRLANTQCTVRRYEDAPVASVSRDGNLVAFNSNFGADEWASACRISGFTYPST
jgi:hypothetical protein